MPGTSFIAALKARYETIVSPAMPTLWSGIAKEGEASDPGYPNLVLTHLGERPDRFSQAGGDGFVIALCVGRVRFSFFDKTMENAEFLAQTLQGVMEAGPLDVYGDDDVWLYREEYRVNITRVRGAVGQFVYEAATTYRAAFNPSGDN